jgi:hypothetical protein
VYTVYDDDDEVKYSIEVWESEAAKKKLRR